MFDEELEEMKEMREVARRRVDRFICVVIPVLIIIMLFILFVLSCLDGHKRRATIKKDVIERQAVMKELYRRGAGTTVCEQRISGTWDCIDEQKRHFTVYVR